MIYLKRPDVLKLSFVYFLKKDSFKRQMILEYESHVFFSGYFCLILLYKLYLCLFRTKKVNHLFRKFDKSIIFII